MRQATVRPPAPSGHVCWSYDDPAAFDARARRFLIEGFEAGERVWYVAAGQPQSMVEHLWGVGGLTEALQTGAAQIISLGPAYRGGNIVDPAAQAHAYATATRDALADGYTGLRVVADATSLVRSPAQLDAFVRYEHLVDRFMRTQRLTGMCASNRRELGDRAVTELACVHPETNADDVPFRLYACHPHDGCATLAGDLDWSSHELFSTTLECADLRPVDGELVVQAGRLRFIDHRSLLYLEDYTRRRDATAVLRGCRCAGARLVELLGLSRVRVEAAR